MNKYIRNGRFMGASRPKAPYVVNSGSLRTKPYFAEKIARAENIAAYIREHQGSAWSDIADMFGIPCKSRDITFTTLTDVVFFWHDEETDRVYVGMEEYERQAEAM